MEDTIPMLIRRCLTHQVRIFPYQLRGVLNEYNNKKIPDESLSVLSEENLKIYVRGLYLSSCESAGEWTEGHEKLKKLGFVEKTREVGHRSFVSLVWNNTEEQAA